MPRYIEADALHSMVARALDANESATDVTDAIEQEHRVLYWILEKIEEQTIVSPDEVRGVVHCGECKFWRRPPSCEGLARCETGETGIRYRSKNDFCSRGAKMEVTDDVL